MTRRRSAFSEFERLHDQMDQMWRRLAGGTPSGRSRFCSPVLSPPTDVYETEDEVVIVSEIAGIEEQDVEIEVEGDHLAFRGEKVSRDNEPNQSHTQMEICYGPFSRSVILPARVDAEAARVSYREGFLRIMLPKLKEQGPRHVRVNVHQTS